MANSISNKVTDLSPLLHPTMASTTGLQINNLPKAQSDLIDQTLAGHLQDEISRVRDAVIAVLPDKKDDITRIFSAMSGLDYKTITGQSLNDVIASHITDGDKKKFSSDELKKFNDALASVAPAAPVGDLLHLDVPLDQNPILSGDIVMAKTMEYGKLTGISADAIQHLGSIGVPLERIDAVTLDDMVKSKLITDVQKTDLLTTAKIGLLSGGNLDLVNAVRSDKVQSPVDLVSWEKSDWVNLITDKKITLPPGEDSADSYAANIMGTIESSFPTEYFLNKTITKFPAADLKSLTSDIEPLLAKNIQLFSDDASQVAQLSDEDLKDIPADKKDKVKASLEALRPIVSSYRYLGFSDVMAGNGSAAAKVAEINKRVDALGAFYKYNPDINIYSTNFSTNLAVKSNDAIAWNDIDPATRPLVQRQMAAFQRSYILGENQEVSDKLLKSGFDSALRIVSLTEEDFIKASGLGVEDGRRVYKKADNLSIGAAHYYGAIRDGVKNVFNNTNASNQYPLVNDLREIDGFDQLFGNQDFCDCEECRSVLGPAAYFCDLMYFVQENVSKKVFTGTNANHPLYLQRRRPDLWTLKLTCDNTSTEIPYLQVVNEVLEKYLQSELAVADIYLQLKTENRSVSQPFDLSLEELRLYLSHFDISLYGIYDEMMANVKDLHRERIKLSPTQLTIVTQPDTAGVGKRFGSRALAAFNVQDFIGYADITRTQLDDLLATTFAPEIAQVKVQRIKDLSDIQKYSEQVNNLTDARLDLIHRYLRLWKTTPWSIPEFDMVLNALKLKGLLNNMEESDAGYQKILQLAQLMIFQDKLSLGVEELATIVYQLPENALVSTQLPFASRIFNLVKLADATVVDKAPYVLSGLGITEVELQALTTLLAIDLTQPITIAVLSLLYRHARIARGLNMTIEDLINALGLVLGGQPVKTFADLQKLIDLFDYLQTTPLAIGDLVFIIKGAESSSIQYANTADSISAKVLEIQTQEAVMKETDPTNKLKLEQGLLKDYLVSTLNLTASQFTDQFLPNLVSDSFDTTSTTALNAGFTNSIPNNVADFDGLVQLIHKLERYLLLFGKNEFTPDNITYIITQKAVFGIADLKALMLADIVNISLYRELIVENGTAIEKMQDALTTFQTNNNFTGKESSLADFWQQPLKLISSLLTTLTLAVPAIDAIRRLRTALLLCEKLGIQGDSLQTLLGADYVAASGVALGAFSSKYPDETIRKGKLEPYTDKLNTLKRDALCDYIISREDKFKFKDMTDLYAFFLLDVEMSGCFRTSYIVAAITSVQLYVMRCLTNLEQSDATLNPAIPNIKVSPTWIPLDEWEWRKNYRVWEANRRVFLYPENYIDPTLRSTQTDIFQELEDELLQQKITKESAETAYKKYISQFASLTRMRFAGAYYNAIYDNYGYANLSGATTSINSIYYIVSSVYFPAESDDSCYYLFARTNVMPYQYYYRTYNHNTKIWGNWIKIDMGIEAKEISSLIFRGRLHIFWTEVKSKELTSFTDGNSNSGGYVFSGFVKYSYLDENGKWSAPQRLTLGQGDESDLKVYSRGRDTSVYNDDRWQKEKDAIVDAFQEKVFRKPYAHNRTSDISTPIGLGYIWSNEKSSSTIKYTNYGFSYSIESAGIGVSFSVPSHSFTIINNDFSAATYQFSIPVTLKVFGASVGVTVGATLQQFSGSCQFSVDIEGIFSISVSVDFYTDNIPAAIKESTFRMSLSRNMITNPADQNIFGGNNLNVYSKEYNIGFSEDGNMAAYVENGTQSQSPHKITQNKDGLGGLHIYNGSTFDYVSANTILTDDLADILYAKGVEEFLSLPTQEITDTSGQQFDFRGPYGEYYWEIFFHIPFLIADHFNANQKFEEAKWWYERIFNPTSEEAPSGTTPSDHNWQFREFRGLTPQKLKDMLTDVKAIEVYKKDPFDPHAIAHLRISAYQKCIVMKYIDNLLDWGDYLFTQDTRESINEAEMLYRLALSILGKRPVKMGSCETADENSLTYAKVGPEIGSGSEFLITLENVYVVQKNDYNVGVGIVKSSKSLAVASGAVMKELDFTKLSGLASVTRISDLAAKIQKPGNPGVNPVAGVKDKLLNVKSYNDRMETKASVATQQRQWAATEKTIDKRKDIDGLKFKKNKRRPSIDLVKQSSMVFCIPENSDLMAYWDRVEDRLFKIWNCMNIKGIRRSLSLFQPPIDPMMLVRLRAAGLSLEDILAMVLNAGKIPNYRFTYLVEKAKQYTQIVQGFGSALLSALEKKDMEELLLLRTMHEKTILKMTEDIKKNQVREAQYQYQSVQENLTNVQNKVDYYQGLIDTGLIAWEVAEQVSKWTAGSIRIAEATMGLLASVFGFLPQIGSPFAMKYGGQELKNGTGRLADATGTLAAIADNIAILAGMEAGHQRREEDWKQQLKLSQQEYKQINQLLLAADIRQQIAAKDLDIHQTAMDQLDELDDFYKNKFTGMGLYNYLASGLNRVYRAAYNITYDLAKLAERAYQFERYDNTFYIQSDNWDFDKAGLLAGDLLMRQLLELEKKYIDNNVRTPEIVQSFSLAALDASQLVLLRQTGTCNIKIPELAFEVFYPGQYRRVIKSVRVTIPCVAGPYTNVSARLTLLKGQIEENENDALKDLDIAKNTSITTSSANNDAGLFELNFQDERYLPFEGAGAISEWILELPSMLRSFNYDTIPDVLIHLSYTALDGDRAAAETALAALLTNFATTTGLFRLFSLKYDFSDSFARLLAQPAQQTDLTVDKMHFPYVLSQKSLIITETKVYLKPKKETTVTVPATMKINGNNTITWAGGEDIAFPGSAGDKNKIKGGTVNLNGDPVKKWTIDAGTSGLNKDDLDDVLILVKYRI